jgi:hypothetical protein
MKSSFIATISLALLVQSASSGQASDGELRFAFAPDQCSGTIPCGESRNLDIFMVLGGATAAGITGLEYSVRIGLDGGPDAGWVFSESWSPSATVILGCGAFRPADAHLVTPRVVRRRGVNLAWPECQTGTDGLVLVETVQVGNLGCTAAELRLLVWGHDSPSNAAFRCPMAVLCDGPTFTKVCLGNLVPCEDYDRNAPFAVCSTSGEAVINPTVHSNSPCAPTAISSETWSTMKSLYRN